MVCRQAAIVGLLLRYGALAIYVLQDDFTDPLA